MHPSTQPATAHLPCAHYTRGAALPTQLATRILILDDSTSSVDTETEAEIREALNGLMQDRTTFIIAHRIQSVMIADLILVLDKGEVVQMGTHAELLAAGGLYARLHAMQFRT